MEGFVSRNHTFVFGLGTGGHIDLTHDANLERPRLGGECHFSRSPKGKFSQSPHSICGLTEIPPSQVRVEPVTKEERSDASQITASAISSGCPTRRMAC